jgi:predicted dehydrogenase
MVGSGFIAAFHSAAYRDAAQLGDRAPRFALQRIASRNAGTAAALADRFGWQSVVADWREVTRGSDIDVVVVCTPDDAHREIAEDAFAHGKHVFCEKPIATSAVDARAMKDAADRAGAVQFVGFVLRFWPALEFVRGMLEAGELGALKNVRARYLLDSETVLESSLRGLGSHVLDALALLAGPVGAVTAITRPTAIDADVDGRAAVLLEFTNGATGVLEVDREAHGRAMDLALEVDCEAGGVAISWRSRDVVAVHAARGSAREPAGSREIVMGPRTSPFAIVALDGLGFALRDLFTVQAQRLASVIAGAAESYPTFGEACHVAEATDAILRAAATRAWQDVPGIG